LNPDTSAASRGELIFGGVDSSKYTGAITYVPVTVEGYWEFQIDSVYVGSTIVSGTTYGIADTGTTFIIGPVAQVQALNAGLGATYDSSNGMYVLDCSSGALSLLPTVTFVIGGTAFALTPSQYLVMYETGPSGYLCYSVFVPKDQQDSYGNTFWILGDYFLFRYYSIFDISNNQVGFAQSISYK